MSREYKDYKQYMASEHTETLLNELPTFCRDFYLGKRLKLAETTQNAYTGYMNTFLGYLHDNNSVWSSKEIKDFTYDDLELIRPEDAREFCSWLLKQPKYPNSTKEKYKYTTNSKKTVINYVAALSSYWTFFVRNGYLSSNPWLALERAKTTQKRIIHIETNDDKQAFLDTAAYGNGLSKRQLAAKKKTAIRDIAICKLLMNTGMRVSELVGLDVDDLMLDNNYCNIVTKGNKETKAFLSDSTVECLREYLNFRDSLHLFSDNRALFVSSAGHRIGERLSVRSIENLVKNTAMASGINDAAKMTPHKLRATRAMDILEKTGNISLVQAELNHSNISTSQIYAKSKETDKESIRNLE